MKIVAGLGSIDDYISLVEAGADEVFCGFVPYNWNKKYGNLFPLNRREVLYYNVQICSYEEMKILKKMMDKYKVPVSITFNYLYYVKEQYEIIYEIIKNLIEIGFNDFIIADIALIEYLNKRSIECSIHLSGECAEINNLSIDFFNKFNGISRYIFHRKNTIDDIKSCINNNSKGNVEFEAFMLNEKCHYSGAFCSSLHCDELEHLCKVPYKLFKVNEETINYPKNYYELYEDTEDDEYVVGSSGCGLCSIKDLKDAGVTHLKVVGRGNSVDNMVKDIIMLKRAIKLLDKYPQNYSKLIKEKLFNNKCSKKCYYN